MRLESLYQPYFSFWLFAWSRCSRIVRKSSRKDSWYQDYLVLLTSALLGAPMNLSEIEYTGSIAKVGRQTGKELLNGLQTVDKRRNNQRPSEQYAQPLLESKIYFARRTHIEAPARSTVLRRVGLREALSSAAQSPWSCCSRRFLTTPQVDLEIQANLKREKF